MNTSKRWIPISLIALLIISIIIAVPAFAQGPGSMMGGGFGSGMMGNYGGGYGGMIGNAGSGYGYGPGSMMGSTQYFSGTTPFGYGMMGGNGYGDMMGSYGMGMMGGMGMVGRGMMFNQNPFVQPEALTLDEATTAVETYVDTLGDDNLGVEDVMVFDTQAYAQIVEKDSGLGAMEVLVDPITKAVYPEMGPNMMWNLKYGMMANLSGYSMMGGMMSGFDYNNMMDNFTQPDVPAEMSVTPNEAVEIAQAYLDAYVPGGLKADEEASPFYGYYTLHINRDGEPVGMLSVNGYTRQVFPHTWHGQFIEMSDDHS